MTAPGRPKRSFLARSATVSLMIPPGLPKGEAFARSARLSA